MVENLGFYDRYTRQRDEQGESITIEPGLYLPRNLTIPGDLPERYGLGPPGHLEAPGGNFLLYLYFFEYFLEYFFP